MDPGTDWLLEHHLAVLKSLIWWRHCMQNMSRGAINCVSKCFGTPFEWGERTGLINLSRANEAVVRSSKGVRPRNAVGLEFGSAFAFRIWEAFEPDSNGLACRDVDTSPCLSNGPHSGFITLVYLLLLHHQPFFLLKDAYTFNFICATLISLDFPCWSLYNDPKSLC